MGFCVAMTKNGFSNSYRTPRHGDRPFLHRLQHGRLRLGRRPVDLVRQTDLRENRSFLELENAFPVGRFQHQVGPQNVGGHQVRGELNTVEVEVERRGQGSNQQCLAEPGNAFEQAMPSHEQTGQHAVHDIVVPHDDSANLLTQGVVTVSKFFGLLLHLLANAHGAFLGGVVFMGSFARRSHAFVCLRDGVTRSFVSRRPQGSP